MLDNHQPGLAIIADAHFHDTASDYSFKACEKNPLKLTLRSWADTRRSSRVYNEAKGALSYALKLIQQRGIQHVVLLGDYSDDGQSESIQRLIALLYDQQEKYGTAFYAIPGNHDYYALHGKHQSTRFATQPGSSQLVTSSQKILSAEAQEGVLSQDMYCSGIPENILPMGSFGLFKQERYLHWESPFGLNDSVDSRTFKIFSQDRKNAYEMMDASYLVEPYSGLWLLMIDANVFEPRNGNWQPTQKNAFLNSSDAGWNAVLKHKAFLLDWIQQVTDRAVQLGKQLVACSHYPIIDPFENTLSREKILFGSTGTHRRTPVPEVAESLARCGLTLHCSGHLHANAYSTHHGKKRSLTDIAVPSLVAFPPCFKVINHQQQSLGVETVNLYSLLNNHCLTRFYLQEQESLIEDPDKALATTSYGAFHYQRMYARVLYYYLPKHWPDELSTWIKQGGLIHLIKLLAKRDSHIDSSQLKHPPSIDNVDPLPQHLAHLISSVAQTEHLEDFKLLTLVTDWYCLRQASSESVHFISQEKISLYERLAKEFGENAPGNNCAFHWFFYHFMNSLGLSLKRMHQAEPSTIHKPQA